MVVQYFPLFVRRYSLPDNYVHDMYDAGLANLESFDSKVYDNIFENVKYGIRISLGGGNNEVYDNTFKGVTKCKSPRPAVVTPPMLDIFRNVRVRKLYF